MSSSTLIEVFGHIVFSFTRGVTEHYNPEEPEFTAESFGYNPLESTGREWFYRPVDELIYQEYSDKEVTSWDYLVSSRLDVRVIDACSPEENEETHEDQKDEDKAMAWKRLRPSALRTVSVMFRVLQADLDCLEYIAILGIIHGAAEVMERSTMVVIDHICHVICKKTLAPWGSFRTPRRERLMADIAIMSMLSESTAIVSVNGFLFLYQFIYLQNSSHLKLVPSFAISTSVQLVIEWFFTSVSLAIETRYQNMPVMAVWRKRWKRHILVAIITVFSVGVWTSGNLVLMLHERFKEPSYQPCKIPFT
ncbi:hypothetical protein ACROYT_G037874 [Oculina patagonica]